MKKSVQTEVREESRKVSYDRKSILLTSGELLNVIRRGVENTIPFDAQLRYLVNEEDHDVRDGVEIFWEEHLKVIQHASSEPKSE